MGVTYTGMYEPMQEIAAALDAIQAKTGFDVRSTSTGHPVA